VAGDLAESRAHFSPHQLAEVGGERGGGAARNSAGASPGDFDRCVPPGGRGSAHGPRGRRKGLFCNERHHEATGHCGPAGARGTGKARRKGRPWADKKPYGGNVSYADPKARQVPESTRPEHAKSGPGRTSTCRRTPASTRRTAVTLARSRRKINGGVQRSSANRTWPDSDAPCRRRRGGGVLPDLRPGWTSRIVKARPRATGPVPPRRGVRGRFQTSPAEIRPTTRATNNEENDPTAFQPVRFDHAARGLPASPFRCIYNHGMTIHGTPAVAVLHPHSGRREEVRGRGPAAC